MVVRECVRVRRFWKGRAIIWSVTFLTYKGRKRHLVLCSSGCLQRHFLTPACKRSQSHQRRDVTCCAWVDAGTEWIQGARLCMAMNLTKTTVLNFLGVLAIEHFAEFPVKETFASINLHNCWGQSVWRGVRLQSTNQFCQACCPTGTASWTRCYSGGRKHGSQAADCLLEMELERGCLESFPWNRNKTRSVQLHSWTLLKFTIKKWSWLKQQ